MKALEMALEALTNPSTIAVSHAIELIRAELAKPKMPTKIFGPNLEQILNAAGFYRREWVGLTDDEIHEIIDACTPNDAELDELNDFAKAVFAVQTKLKEKNT